MKIGLMHNLYGEFKRGGAENIVKQQARELHSLGHEIFLITTKPSFSAAAPKSRDEDGLRIYRLRSGFYDLGARPAYLRFFWHLADLLSIRKYRQIKKILSRENPDLVITHNLMGLGFLAPFALKRRRIRWEHCLHDIQLLHPSGLMIFGQEGMINSFGAKIYQALTKRLFSSPQRIISPSRWIYDLHRKYGFFLDVPADIRPWRQKDERGSSPKAKAGALPASRTAGRKKLLFVGQIEDHKGIFLLLRSFMAVDDKNLSLKIAGDGQRLKQAEKIAMDDRRIEFLGRLKSRKIKEIMAASDWLVVPSLCYENSPTVIYEAQALDLPVLAANLGGIPEITGPDDRLFQPGDEKDLRKELENISRIPS